MLVVPVDEEEDHEEDEDKLDDHESNSLSLVVFDLIEERSTST